MLWTALELVECVCKARLDFAEIVERICRMKVNTAEVVDPANLAGLDVADEARTV